MYNSSILYKYRFMIIYYTIVIIHCVINVGFVLISISKIILWYLPRRKIMYNTIILQYNWIKALCLDRVTIIFILQWFKALRAMWSVLFMVITINCLWLAFYFFNQRCYLRWLAQCCRPAWCSSMTGSQ